jgi:hypothetical protein
VAGVAGSLPGWVGIGCEVYHYAMNRIRPEFVDPYPADRPVAGDVLVREEPDDDEEEDNEEDDEDEDEDDNGNSDGYSE